MAEIPEPIITETEALEVASEKIDKKKKIIKRKSPKSNNATTNKSSSASDITNNAPDTSLDGILAGESSVKEKKKRSVSKKVDKNTNADVIIDTSYLRVANEKLVLELKQDLTKLNKAKELLRTIDFAHDTLFKSNENISGLAAFNDITNFLFIKLLKPYLYFAANIFLTLASISFLVIRFSLIANFILSIDSPISPGKQSISLPASMACTFASPLGK